VGFFGKSCVTPLIGVLASILCLAAVRAQQNQSPPAAAANPRQPVADFVDKAVEAGLTAPVTFGGAVTKKYIIETTGTGVAIFDFDNDGWPDILIVNGTTLRPRTGEAPPLSHLYRNRHDGTFEDVTAKSGINATGWGQGVCVGDYDNDGFDDLFITYFGKNHLYHNNGNGTFTDVSDAAGVGGDGKHWGSGCAFVDYDRDGKLDLIVANYVDFDLASAPQPGEGPGCIWKGTPVMCGPRGLKPARNILYHNLGGGKFEDVSKTSGIENTPGHYSLSISTLDYNHDGWPDLYIACDSTPSILYRNNHDGTFTDVGVVAGAALNEDGRAQAGMGTAIADYDGDGWLDIFKTNFSDDTSTLYRNNGDGTFTDATFAAGLGLHTQYLGWGAAFLDFDNDGWPDVLTVNGHVYPEVDEHHLGAEYREPKILYRNQGNGTFQDVSDVAGLAIRATSSARGLAVGDLWNDGRISAVISNMGERPALLVNNLRNQNHWIGLRLVGTKSNRDGIGASVTVVAGARRMTNEVRSGSSYLSQNDLRLHFGLGQIHKIDRVEIHWPSGLAESFNIASVDSILTLKEGAGQKLEPGK
jgi:hypothetical protein